jgi:hypothetical protein
MSGKLAAVAIAALAAIGLGAGLELSASAGAAIVNKVTTSSAVTSRAATSKAVTASRAVTASTAQDLRYVVLNCNDKPEARPGTYVLTCADGGMYLQGLHWTSWTAKLASGYGTFWENDCTPDCAAGHFHQYPALAMLWDTAKLKGYPGDRQYVRLTLVFTGKRPPVYVLKNGKEVATYPLTQTFDI